MTPRTTESPDLAQLVSALHARQRFVITSHARPDGDALGSGLALAFALRALGKDVRVVSADPPPAPLLVFPGMAGVEVVTHVDDPGDAVIVMECGDLARTGITGLDGVAHDGVVINIDHHIGNTGYGTLNWFDGTAAACAEMVFDLVAALGVPLTAEIAVHVYIAILTDTGSFHYSSITPRTFDIARQCMEAGVHPPTVARAVYDSNTIGRLKIFGAALNRMQFDPSGQVATLCLDDALMAACGATGDDTDGLINFPLTAKDVQAVVMFKEAGPERWRVSMRSKGEVDINAVARRYGGGGHKNASGCSATGSLDALIPAFQQQVLEQIAQASA